MSALAWTGSLLSMAGALWALHYRLTAVQTPGLVFRSSDFNLRVVDRLADLRRPYRPTPWLYNTHLQLAWLLLQETIAPPLRYERTDVLRMRDGGTTSLDWLGLDSAPQAPTLVLLHTVTGSPQSMRLLARDLREATGWRLVLCTRRGHGGLPLTAPVINTMGCTDDLREQLQCIQAQCPDSPLYAVGASAGSGLLVRYLGEEGARSRIRAGVAYCPGYDIGVAWSRVRPFYSRAMATRLKRHFLESNARTFGHLTTFGSCMAATDIAEFHDRLYEMAGCVDRSDYLARSNPVVVFKNVSVPLLVLNADDDPVCVVDNTLDHLDTIRALSNTLLVRTTRGSHCAFYEGWSARSWAHRLLANYLIAAHELLESDAASGALQERESAQDPLS
ncbi:MAG: YheT family hydrolase [Panacagrimonas sp.]